MAIHTERIRPTSATTETVSEGLVGSPESLNRNAFRELDYYDPASSSYDENSQGDFRIVTSSGTYNVDGGTVTSPVSLRLNRQKSNTSGGSSISSQWSALLLRNPLRPGEELEISFYTADTGQALNNASVAAASDDDFLGVFYQDDSTQWESFSSTPLAGGGSGTNLIGKGVVPASTSTNIGVINGGFQYSSGRSNSSFSQARNSDDSGNQTDAKLYAFNLPSHGTATALSRFFRVTIKNNSPKPAMLKMFLVNETGSSSDFIYRNLYDFQGKLTSPGGGIVKKEDLKGPAVIGSNAANNLSLGGAELVIKSEEGSNRIFTHLDLQLMPTINAQYFLHNVHGASGNYAAATGIFLSFLPNPGVGAPAAADFELRSPYVFMAPKNGRFVCTKLAFNNLQTGTIKVSVYAYSTKTTVGDALTSGFSSYLPGGTAHSHLNTSVTSARTVEATWGVNSTFSAGDLIWVGVEFPTATRTINGYTVIEWTD